MIHRAIAHESLDTANSRPAWNRATRANSGQRCIGQGHRFFFDGESVIETESGCCLRGAKSNRYAMLTSRRFAESA